jgi:hypothetical protein
MTYQVLEHDPTREAFIEPAKVCAGRAVPEHRVICFFRDVLDRVVPYLIGRAWTTDGPYRETRAKIAQRRAEGCVTVEMEAAGMMEEARFRGVPLALMLYAGDDLSGAEWDKRSWYSCADFRKGLFWLAAGAVLSL